MATPLYELYMENNPLDESFFEDSLIYMLDKEPELKDYIRDLLFTEEETKAYGEYSKDERRIYIHLDNFTEEAKKNKMIPLMVIRHELEHARNLKTLLTGGKDIETTVIDFASRDYLRKHGIYRFPEIDQFDELSYLYKKRENYKFNPEERLANIRAWKFLVNLLKNQRDTEDILTARLNLLKAYSRGYKQNEYYIEPPTYKFLVETNLFRDLYLLAHRVDDRYYSFDTRLTYGLPLKDYEFKKKIYIKAKIPSEYR